MEFTDKGVTIIKEIANSHRPSQRGIAKNTGLSLGLVKLIIERLIKQDYVKTKHLDQKSSNIYLPLTRTRDTSSQIKLFPRFQESW